MINLDDPALIVGFCMLLLIAGNERTHSTMLRGFHPLWLEMEPA